MHIASIVDPRPAEHAGARGDAMHRLHGTRNDLGPRRRDRSVPSDELGRLDSKVRGPGPSEAGGGPNVPSADDRGQTERCEPRDRLLDLTERDRMLGVVDQTSPTTRGMNGLGRHEPGKGARRDRVDVLGENRDRDRRGDPGEIRRRGGDRDRHAGGGSGLLERAGGTLRRPPELAGIDLEVQEK